MVNVLPPPTRYDLKFLQGWLERPSLGNCAFTGADYDVYERPAGLATLARGGGEVDAMTKLLVNVLPNLYHWGIVHPLHRICGKWIKVIYTHGSTMKAAHTEFCRNRKNIESDDHHQHQIPRPATTTTANLAKTSLSDLLPPPSTHQHSLPARRAPQMNHPSTSKPISSYTATHTSTALPQ